MPKPSSRGGRGAEAGYLTEITALNTPQNLQARDVAAVSQQADSFELCHEPFHACMGKFYISFRPKLYNVNDIFLSIGLDFYAGDQGAAFQNWEDILAILAPCSRNKDLYAIGKAK